MAIVAEIVEMLPGGRRRSRRAIVGRVAIATPGFLTEGLETLEEIEIRGRRTFEEAGGGELLRIPAVEAHPDFVRSLAALVSGRSA